MHGRSTREMFVPRPLSAENEVVRETACTVTRKVVSNTSN